MGAAKFASFLMPWIMGVCVFSDELTVINRNIKRPMCKPIVMCLYVYRAMTERDK